MSAACFSPDLPWSSNPKDEARLRRLTTVAMLITLVIGAIVPLVPVPKPSREEAELPPARVAQVILERRQLPPPPVVVPAPEPARTEAPPPELPKTTEVPKEKSPPTPVQKDVTAAREKAARSGLLALQNEFAELRDQAVDTQVFTREQRPAAAAPAVTSVAAEAPRRSVLTANTTGSGGIDSSKVSKETGGTRLAGREVTQVESKLSARADQNEATATGGRSGKAGRNKARSTEAIQLVFDRNKGAIYSIYNRALREDPAIQGKLVLELTIASSGKVLNCRVVSSELNAPALVKKVVARVKMFDFGPQANDTIVVTYPIDFLPS